jgi:hypothetical protein
MKLILEAREIIIRLYKQYETGILFVLKLFIGITAFSSIAGIGYAAPMIKPFFAPPLAMPMLLLLSVLYVLLPSSVSYALMILDIGAQLSSSTEIAVIVVLALFCLLFFYARLAPQESFLVLATLAAYYMKIPYLVPLLAGLYCGVTAIIPIGIGVFLWNYIPVVHELIRSTTSAGFNVMEMAGTVGPVLNGLVVSLTSDLTWIFTAFIFAMVTLSVYGISRMGVNYAKELSIGLGALLTIISFTIAQFMVQTRENVGIVIVFTLLSVVIALIVRFFDIVLDYSRAERVEFEDEENYYFVKVVPKAILARRKKAARRIRPQREIEE